MTMVNQLPITIWSVTPMFVVTINQVRSNIKTAVTYRIRLLCDEFMKLILILFMTGREDDAVCMTSNNMCLNYFYHDH